MQYRDAGVQVRLQSGAGVVCVTVKSQRQTLSSVCTDTEEPLHKQLHRLYESGLKCTAPSAVGSGSGAVTVSRFLNVVNCFTYSQRKGVSE